MILIIRHLPYSYILLQEEGIFHIHIFLSNKNTSSIAIYSCPTRRHLPQPYILLQQEDIFHNHIFFSNKTTYILLQQEDIFFSHKKKFLVSVQHILCLKSTHMSPEHTCRVHKGQTWSKSKKLKIQIFSRDWRMTFGMSNTIITDSF